MPWKASKLMHRIDPNTRCQHTTAAGTPFVSRSHRGRRCQSPRAEAIGDGQPAFCLHHARQHQPQSPASGPTSIPNLRDQSPTSDVSSDLIGPVQDFRTAASINHALGKLFILLAGNRIAPRQAAVLAYICQLLLQSLSEVKNEVNVACQYDDVHDELARVLDATSPLRENGASRKGNA